MLQPPIPNKNRSLLEKCDTQQLISVFEYCLKTGSSKTEFGQLSDVWGTLFSQLYLFPQEIVDEMQSGEHRLGEINERMLREFITADCANGGTFVLDVIKKGGVIDRSVLLMIANLEDLVGIHHDGKNAIVLLFNACDKRVRPLFIEKAGSGLLSSYDRNGIPLIFSILGLGELSTYDLEAITKVFSKDDLRKIMTKTKMGKNALEVFTEVSASMKYTVSKDWTKVSGSRAKQNPDRKTVAKKPISPPVGDQESTVPQKKVDTHITSELSENHITEIPGPSITQFTEQIIPIPVEIPKWIEDPSMDIPDQLFQPPLPAKTVESLTETPAQYKPTNPDLVAKKGKIKKIMIVEDDPIILHLLQLRLQILGYEICALAESGEEAVKLALDTKPDLVFMDISMPGKIDGIEAAREIKVHSHSRIIFLTGFSDQEILDRAKEIQPEGYILKPFTDTDIRVAIQLAE
jgi:CheY-like chemotaxis protein